MTRVLLDACVLFPSVMREILLGAADGGLLTLFWSEPILQEWGHAAARRDAQTGAVAQTEILLLKARWPKAMVVLPSGMPPNFALPDINDHHVLQAAIVGQVQELVTANLRDFPTRVLARFDIIRRDPDGLLLEIAQNNNQFMQQMCQEVVEKAALMEGKPLELRKVLRKTGLPRLGKYLANLR